MRRGWATHLQVEVAAKLGIDIASDSSHVGQARLRDRLTEHNWEAIERMNLQPGDQVLDYTRGLYMDQTYIVSSIRENGLVFFRGGQGKGAWAMKLKKVEVTV